MAKFYYEEKNMLSKWCPVKSSGRPLERTAEGSKPRVRQVTEIAPEHEHLSLVQLRDIYGYKEESIPPAPEPAYENFDMGEG